MKRIHVLVLLLLASINTASAAIVTNISNLLIWGDRYDVTIHTNGSFNDIWDANGNGNFTDDASGLNHEPTFMGNRFLAERAVEAVRDELGVGWPWDGWSLVSDAIMVPWAGVVSDPTLVWVVQDSFPFYAWDPINEGVVSRTENYTITESWAWVSYEPVTAVPIPAAVWLFGSAMAGLGLVTRKRKGVEVA